MASPVLAHWLYARSQPSTPTCTHLCTAAYILTALIYISSGRLRAGAGYQLISFFNKREVFNTITQRLIAAVDLPPAPPQQTQRAAPCFLERRASEPFNPGCPISEVTSVPRDPLDSAAGACRRFVTDPISPRRQTRLIRALLGDLMLVLHSPRPPVPLFTPDMHW